MEGPETGTLATEETTTSLSLTSTTPTDLDQVTIETRAWTISTTKEDSRTIKPKEEEEEEEAKEEEEEEAAEEAFKETKHNWNS